jgi:hyperosmotically inducible periplasmic protein
MGGKLGRRLRFHASPTLHVSSQARFTGRNKWQRMKRKNARIRRVAAQQSQETIAVFSVKRWKRHLTLIVAADTPDARVRLTRIDVGLASMWHKGENMKSLVKLLGLFSVMTFGMLAGCSSSASKSPDVTDSVRKSLDQASLNDVTVKQDRDKGVVTLGGHVKSDADKSQAEAIAKSNAGSQVVADEIAVVPPGVEREARAVNSDLDKGIDKNLDAAFIKAGLNKDVKYDVKNGVVTLTGSVNSQTKKTKAEAVASKVPNVQQVVNELEVKNPKATSTN